MNFAWLHRNWQKQCLLFFSGWGMDLEPFRTLPTDGLDVCMCSDYRQLEEVSLAPFASYEQLHLLAWSMGVWVAAHLLAGQEAAFVNRTALGGTLFPLDQRRGIPPDRYQALIESFNLPTLEGFQRSMFEDTTEFNRFFAHRPRRDLQGLDEELRAFGAAYDQHGPAADIYTQAIITSRDRVYSGRNQLRAWAKEKSTVIDWPHFPFYTCSGWHQLLSPIGNTTVDR